MADARQFDATALSLAGTVAAPHFDRTAYKVRRIYATLAPDGKSANLNFTPDEQELFCMTHSTAFAPVQNAWGRQGWTTLRLAEVSTKELRNALEVAWRHSQQRPKRRVR